MIMKKIFLILTLILFMVSQVHAYDPLLIFSGMPAAPPSGQSFSDDFATDPFTSRFGYLTTIQWYHSGDSIFNYNSPAATAVYYNAGQTDTANQYVKIESAPDDGYVGAAFRSDGTGSNGYYAVYIWGGSAYFSLWNDTGEASEIESLGAVTYTSGNALGVTVCGTGASTVARIWLSVTANAPGSCTSWDSGAADVTSSTDPGTYYDSNRYLGLVNGNWAHSHDNFYGGDVP